MTLFAGNKLLLAGSKVIDASQRVVPLPTLRPANSVPISINDDVPDGTLVATVTRSDGTTLALSLQASSWAKVRLNPSNGIGASVNVEIIGPLTLADAGSQSFTLIDTGCSDSPKTYPVACVVNPILLSGTTTIGLLDNAANGTVITTLTRSDAGPCGVSFAASPVPWSKLAFNPSNGIGTSVQVVLVDADGLDASDIGQHDFSIADTTAKNSPVAHTLSVTSHGGTVAVMPTLAGVFNSGVTTLAAGTQIDRGRYLFPKGSIPTGQSFTLSLGGQPISSFSATQRTYYVSDNSLMSCRLLHALPASIAAAAHPKYTFTPSSSAFNDTEVIGEGAMPGALTVKVVISGAVPAGNNGTYYFDLNYALGGPVWSRTTGYGSNPTRGRIVKGNGRGGKTGNCWMYLHTAPAGGGNMHDMLGGEAGWTILPDGRARVLIDIGNITYDGSHPSATAGVRDGVSRHYGTVAAFPSENCVITVQLGGVDVPGLSWSNVPIGCRGYVMVCDIRSSDQYLRGGPIEINANGTIGAMPDFLCSQDHVHVLEKTRAFPNHPHGASDVALMKSSWNALGTSATDPIPYVPGGFMRQMWMAGYGNSKNQNSEGAEGGLWEFGPGFYGLEQSTDKKARALLRNGAYQQVYKRWDGIAKAKGSQMDASRKWPANTYIHQAASNLTSPYPTDIRLTVGPTGKDRGNMMIDAIWGDGWDFESMGAHNWSVIAYACLMEPDPLLEQCLTGWRLSSADYYHCRFRFASTTTEDFITHIPWVAGYQNGDVRTMTQSLRNMFYTYMFVCDEDPGRGINMGYFHDCLRVLKLRLTERPTVSEPFNHGIGGIDFAAAGYAAIGHFEYTGSDGGEWIGAINMFQNHYWVINIDQWTYFNDFMSDEALAQTLYTLPHYNGIANFTSHRQCIGEYSAGGVFQVNSDQLVNPGITTWTALMPTMQYYNATPPTGQWCDISGLNTSSQLIYARMHMSAYAHKLNAIAVKQGTLISPTLYDLTITAGGWASRAAFITDLITAQSDAGEAVFWRIPVGLAEWLI